MPISQYKVQQYALWMLKMNRDMCFQWPNHKCSAKSVSCDIVWLFEMRIKEKQMKTRSRMKVSERRITHLRGVKQRIQLRCVYMCVFCYYERFKPHVLCKKTHPNNFHTPTGWNGLKDAKGEASWEGVGCSIRPACFAATKKKWGQKRRSKRGTAIERNRGRERT